jgi:hypothetical protein
MSIATLTDAIRASGATGMTGDDIACLILGHSRDDAHDVRAVYSALRRVRSALQGTGEDLQSTKPGYRTTRYVIAGAAVAPPKATTSIPSVSRRITGDLGLGSTPGAMVSVARVSFLDGHP